MADEENSDKETLTCEIEPYLKMADEENSDKETLTCEIESIFEDAEKSIENKGFDLPAAKRLVETLRNLAQRYGDKGSADTSVERIVLMRACKTSEKIAITEDPYDVHQTLLYLCCGLVVFRPPSEFIGPDGQLVSTFECEEVNICLQRINILVRVCHVRTMFEGSEGLENCSNHLQLMLELSLWLERETPFVAFIICLNVVQFLQLIIISQQPLPSPQIKITLHILLASCLIGQGRLDIAKTFYNTLSREVNTDNMSAPLFVKYTHVYARLLQDCGHYDKALDHARDAFRTSTDEGEKAEIQELIDQLDNLLRESCQQIRSTCGAPQEEWLDGTNVNLPKVCADQQKMAVQRHSVKPKPEQPKKRFPQKRSSDRQPTNNHKTTTATSAFTRPRSTQRASSDTLKTNIATSPRCILPAPIKLPVLSDTEEESEDDGGDNTDYNFNCFNAKLFTQAQDEDTAQVDALPKTDDDETWFGKSEDRILQCLPDVDITKGIEISEEQMKDFDTGKQREAYYKDLHTDTRFLRELINKNPHIYKRCQLQIMSAHHSIAKVLDPKTDFHDVNISGRRQCGRTYNEDEVVVEVIAEPGQSSGLQTTTKKSNASLTTVEKQAYGQVIGLLKRNRYNDVEHPILLCTLDDKDGNLMRPLCKTVPKIHVNNYSAKDTLPALARNRIEVNEIDSNGNVHFKSVVNIDLDKREQYVFQVAIISWMNQFMYPLGVVLHVHIGGKDYEGGLEVLCLQQKVPTFYPRSAITHTKDLLQNESPDTRGRENLTTEQIFTIDSPVTKDIDDALSIWKKDGYFVVGIHIADVAALVKKGTPTDLEAQKRAVTFYPFHRNARNMLPEPLSEEKCSLIPNEIRLTLSVFFYFDKSGKLVKDIVPEVKKSYIKSRYRLSYNDVQKIIHKTQDKEVDISLCEDILQLHIIASKLRDSRRMNSKVFVPFDDPRLHEEQTVNDCLEAHSLVEEFMVLTNTHIAQRLTKRFPRLMILRTQKSPTSEQLDKWLEREGKIGHLVMQLQDKHISPKTKLCMDNVVRDADKHTEHHNIIIQTHVWERLKKALETEDFDGARKLVFMDALHPLQCIAHQHWLELMESAVYQCSSGLSQSDHFHFSLNTPLYTQFTSPIRRYVDLYVQRLLHADMDNGVPDYTPEEVAQLCQHINRVKARQTAFGRGCRALKIADRLQSQPLVFRAYVDQMDTEQIGLCVPSLLPVSSHKQGIHFNVMGITSQPKLTKDTKGKRGCVSVTWDTRIYNKSGHCPKSLAKMKLRKERELEDIRQKSDGHTRFQPIDVDINPNQLTVTLKQEDWSGILRALKHKHTALSNIPKPLETHSNVADCITSETGDKTISLHPCHFNFVFSPGQVLQVQMTSEPSRGMLKPCIDLVQTTRNVNVCLKHTRDPVSALSCLASRATRQQKFNSFQDYIQAWVPLLEMEAAFTACDNGSTVLLENVQICMKKQIVPQSLESHIYTGTFKLSSKFCFERWIELGMGLQDENGDTRGCSSDRYPCTLSYLCIRYKTQDTKHTVFQTGEEGINVPIEDHYIWVGHAKVIKVKSKNRNSTDGGEKQVTFVLNHNSPPPPEKLTSASGDQAIVEILHKSEVEMRAQRILFRLEEKGCELARALAYCEKIPKLDKDRRRYGAKQENHEVIGQGEKFLPPNNESQSQAIQMALTQSFSVIQGPPGTGKTYTGVKLVYLFNKINKQLESEGKGKKTVLYCGPSNRSVDLVAEILINRLGSARPRIVRMYGTVIESKDFPVPRGNLRSARRTRDLKSGLSLKDITLHRIIRQRGKPHAENIAKFEHFFNLCHKDPKRYKVTDKELQDYRKLLFKATVEELRHYDVVLATCAVGGSNRLVKGLEGQVFQVIIDECAMSMEPHCLMPIIATKAKQVVLIGDHKQLRPIVMCQPAAELGLDQSLFERFYHDPLTKKVFLNEQYRMHPAICEFPSTEFYDGKLKTENSMLWNVIPLPFWPRDPRTLLPVPHILVDVRGEEESLTVSTDDGNERSRSNRQEVEKVVEIVSFLKKNYGKKAQKKNADKNYIWPTSIKVLTQYNAQRHLLEENLRPVCTDVQNTIVSTVVASQGGEWDYVILSTVRSLPSYKIEHNPTKGWCRQNLGFITDRNQVNVALTRARRGLIIVGNKELLQCDEVWRHLVERYERMDCIRQSDKFPPKKNQPARKQENASKRS